MIVKILVGLVGLIVCYYDLICCFLSTFDKYICIVYNIVDKELILMEKRQQKALISVRVTNKFKSEYEILAESKGMTLPDLVRYILMQYLENERNK